MDTVARPDWSRRPAADEHAEYYRSYVALVPDGDLLAELEAEGRRWAALLRAFPADRERRPCGTDGRA